MTERDQDEAAFEKILEAADRIADMARTRPNDAAALLERSRYLRNLAEDIRRDWRRRFVTGPDGSSGADTDDSQEEEMAGLASATA
jgi:hypothetical protein